MVRNACIGVALISAVPFAVIAVRGDALWFEFGDARQRILDAEQMRGLSAPVDPAVTVEQAGAALHALQAMPSSEQFPTLPQTAPIEWTWQSRGFPHKAIDQGERLTLPESKDLIARAHAGLSDEELAHLRTIAESPVWSAVDQLASAARVDYVGSQFVLPFNSDAWSFDMPIQGFYSTKEVAYAGIARAAFYVATDDFERAEHALRTVVSYGFSFIDNGTRMIDGLIGRVIVGIANDGIAQLAVVRGDAASMNAVAAMNAPRTASMQYRAPRRSATDVRAQYLRDATDPALPRPLRYESLSRLALGSCGDARWVLRGVSPDVRAAFDDARSTLARFPADQAYLDMLYRTPDVLPEDQTKVRSVSKRMLLGAATVAATALQNPRVLSCTRLLMAIDGD